ncbi:MAG TPA: glycine zipper 2TM domain-containing protein [Pseudomonadales bacterium]
MSAKRLCVAAAMTLLVTAGAVRAEPSGDLPEGGGYYAYADVIDVTPRYGWHEVSEPVLQCVEPSRPVRRYGHHDDYRVRHLSGDGAAGLVGGLIGGLIGHQFGGGNGKTALTIAGAAIGASVARDFARERREFDRYDHGDWRERHEPVRHCTETYRTRRVRGVNGYDVTYRYRGATFHKWVDEHPGDVIRVRVDVEPVVDG